uniref:Uncharacterized protein n=1 Tax=Geospiza parvula TaxID=87175 RepID=A0A8U8C9T0_GEOPR
EEEELRDEVLAHLIPLGLSYLATLCVHQVTGTWMASTTLPCTYVPTEDFTQQTLSWSVEQGSSTSTIFRRDDSGDHILLSQFRGRVSVPKHSPGDASLLIQNLEMPDSGHYTCQIIWRSRDNSLITREVTTIVKVVKGKCSSKPAALGQRHVLLRGAQQGWRRLPGSANPLPRAKEPHPPALPGKEEMPNAFSTLTQPCPLPPACVLLHFLCSISSSLRNCSFLMQKRISTSNIIYLFIYSFVGFLKFSLPL